MDFGYGQQKDLLKMCRKGFTTARQGKLEEDETMLVVIAKLAVKPGNKAELLALAHELITATRAELGCISYALLDDPQDAGACVFLEEWTDKPALAQHLTTAHISEWHQKSKELLAGKTMIKLYQAEEAKL